MIIYESLLTTFEAIVIFETAEAVVEIGLSFNANHHNQVEPS